METVEKQRSTKRRRLSSNNNKTTTPVDVKDLPQVFHDEPATENFYGFTGKDRSVPVHKVTLPDEVAKYFESDDEDFKGFTVDKRYLCAIVCVCACVRACVHACVRACVRACMHVL